MTIEAKNTCMQQIVLRIDFSKNKEAFVTFSTIMYNLKLIYRNIFSDFFVVEDVVFIKYFECFIE